MNELKHNVVRYYESCLNVIDMHAESLLSNPDIKERDVQHINSLRDQFISEIRKIERFNLENLQKYSRKVDKIIYVDYLINLAFQNKFCFFVPNDPNRGHLFKSNRFGVLVILNQFINTEIIESLIELSNRIICLHDLNHLVNDFDEFLKTFTIYELISSKANESIIDLSSLENNVLNRMDIKCALMDLDSFDWLESILNLQQLETLTFGFKSLNYFDKSLFSKFDNLKWLRFESGNLNLIQEANFAALTNLKRLTFEIRIDKIDKKGFDGLNRLEKLEFCSSGLSKLSNFELNKLDKLQKLSIIYHSIEEIEQNSLKLSDLKIFRLESNKIKRIQSEAFKFLINLQELYLDDQKDEIKFDNYSFAGLKNLKILSLQKNFIQNLNSDLFNDLKELEYLSLRQNSIKLLNPRLLSSLVSLQFLDLSLNQDISLDFEKLELNNLKFLVINASKIPNLFKFKLQGLQVVGLDDFSAASFDNQSQIEYLNLGFRDCNSILESISNYSFEQINSLKYLKIKFLNTKTDFKAKLDNFSNQMLNSFKNREKSMAEEIEKKIVNKIEHNQYENSCIIQISNICSNIEFFEKHLQVSDITRKAVLKNVYQIHFN